jgi:hypothetical protein
MTLPRNLGGQGVRGMKLNYGIALPKNVQRVAGKSSYRIDLFDPQTNVGFEYLGELYHSGMIRGVADLRRESILQSLDIKVHGVTKMQARNLSELNRFARIVYRERGLKYRAPTPAQTQCMLGLLRVLYGAGPASR